MIQKLIQFRFMVNKCKPLFWQKINMMRNYLLSLERKNLQMLIWARSHKNDDFKFCSKTQKTSTKTLFCRVDSYSHQLNPTSHGCSTWKRTRLSLPVSAGTRSALWSTSACFPSTWLDAVERIRGSNEEQHSECDRIHLMSREQAFWQVIIALCLCREGESQSWNWITGRKKVSNKH